MSPHDHDHHAELRKTPLRRLAWAFGITAAFMLVEAGMGWWSKSLALLADAVGTAAVSGLLAGTGRDGGGTAVDVSSAASTRAPGSFLDRVCELAVVEVGVSGAGITLMASVTGGLAGHRDQVCSSDGLSRRLEDLQLTTGEGPVSYTHLTLPTKA